VHLLTLTKGGATKQRFKLNYSITEMGEVRYREMLNVEKTLGLTSMTVLDLPDSRLKDMDPRKIEKIVEDYISKIKPDIVLTYPVYGISGFYDHLVCHAVVKRVFVEMQGRPDASKRLAFFGLSEDDLANSKLFNLKAFTKNEIDCVVTVDDQDLEKGKKALDCYVTYKETIEKSNIKNALSKNAPFEFFLESCDPPLTSLFDQL
jgi:LmbE family N-acetylglucosaminyl deacetylase